MAIPTVTIIHNEYGRQWREAISIRDFNPKKHVLADQPAEPEADKAFKASKPKKKVKTVEDSDDDFDTQPFSKDDLETGLIDQAFDE